MSTRALAVTPKPRRPREKMPTPIDPRSRVRDEARALYRKAILDAAEEVFAERGVASARVQDIAARARLAVGTIYNHFEQKEDVLVALLGERTIGFLEAFSPQPTDGKAFEERLVSRMIRLLSYIGSHRQFFQVANDHGLLGPAIVGAEKLLGGKKVPHSGEFETAMAQVVDEGMKEGVLGDYPPAFMALQLRHTIRTASQWVKQAKEQDVEELSRWVVELFMGGAGRKERRFKK
jgi:AcrR family transcriptional regulator